MRVALLALMLASPAMAQTPRTASGRPDLQGVWNNITATPLERPAAFDSLTTTEERAAAFEKTSADAFTGDTSDGVGGRQSEWWELVPRMVRIGGEIRTSLIVDPPDGKLPYSPAGRDKLNMAMKANLALFDDPETRPSPERCLTGGSGSTGAPIFAARYNGNYRLVQTDTHFVIAMEQNSNLRIVPIGGARTGLRRWMGESVGRWDGDTLVVETKGFHPGDAFKPASPIYVSANAAVTERFTRLSKDEMLYQFEVRDPEAFTQTWRAEQTLHATANPIYEYACHEGNYGVANALKGGRMAEERAAKAKPRKP